MDPEEVKSAKKTKLFFTTIKKGKIFFTKTFLMAHNYVIGVHITYFTPLTALTSALVLKLNLNPHSWFISDTTTVIMSLPHLIVYLTN